MATAGSDRWLLERCRCRRGERIMALRYPASESMSCADRARIADALPRVSVEGTPWPTSRGSRARQGVGRLNTEARQSV